MLWGGVSNLVGKTVGYAPERKEEKREGGKESPSGGRWWPSLVAGKEAKANPGTLSSSDAGLAWHGPPRPSPPSIHSSPPPHG